MQDRISERLARFGYAARGLVYLVVGGLAVLAALGRSGTAPDTKGALTTLLSGPFGAVLLGVVALGLLCFALWRAAQALLDADHLGTEPKALVRRAGFAAGALVNAGLALSAASLVVGISAGLRSGEASAQDWTAHLLALPFGRWLVALVGLAIVGTGIGAGVKGWRATFEEHLALDEGTRAWVRPLGHLGYLARGLVFVVAGAFLVLAALHADAHEARGLAGALRALRDQPYGGALLLVTALGLFSFGAFQVVVARYRRIAAPSPRQAAHALGERMRDAVETAR